MEKKLEAKLLEEQEYQRRLPLRKKKLTQVLKIAKQWSDAFKTNEEINNNLTFTTSHSR